MINNFIISGICFFLFIFLFTKYNSGSGATMGSLKKKTLYVLSFLAFLAFIVFLNRGYYYSDNQKQNQIIAELKKEACDLDKIIVSQFINQGFVSQKKLFDKRRLLLQTASDTISNNDTIHISTLINQYFESEDMIKNRDDSMYLLISEKYSTVEELILKLDSSIKKERDMYFNILINILSTFIAFVIAFTFKNRILG